MRKIKVGDYVRVLPRKDSLEYPFYLDEMLEFVGRTMKVERITKEGNIVLENCTNDSGIEYKWKKNWLELCDMDFITPKLEYKMIDDKALVIPKEIVFNEQNKRTTLIFNNGVVRTQTHETDTHDNWFGFLIAMTKHHFRNDNTKYRRFIEQLYSYPKKRMEVALEFFVYNVLSSYLSNYQFNKLKNRIQKLNTTESVITFKDFEIKVKLKNIVPF